MKSEETNQQLRSSSRLKQSQTPVAYKESDSQLFESDSSISKAVATKKRLVKGEEKEEKQQLSILHFVDIKEYDRSTTKVACPPPPTAPECAV